MTQRRIMLGNGPRLATPYSCFNVISDFDSEFNLRSIPNEIYQFHRADSFYLQLLWVIPPWNYRIGDIIRKSSIHPPPHPLKSQMSTDILEELTNKKTHMSPSATDSTTDFSQSEEDLLLRLSVECSVCPFLDIRNNQLYPKCHRNVTHFSCFIEWHLWSLLCHHPEGCLMSFLTNLCCLMPPESICRTRNAIQVHVHCQPMRGEHLEVAHILMKQHIFFWRWTHHSTAAIAVLPASSRSR